jgi:hypothetical protein
MSTAAEATSAKQAELILRELDALPTLPSVAARLMAITGSDDADVQEVIRLIEADPAVTAKVLSLCSRAALGMSRQVTTVDRAVVMLGLDAVRSAVLSVQIVDWMRDMGMSVGASVWLKPPRRGGGRSTMSTSGATASPWPAPPRSSPAPCGGSARATPARRSSRA